MHFEGLDWVKISMVLTICAIVSWGYVIVLIYLVDKQKWNWLKILFMAFSSTATVWSFAFIVSSVISNW